MDITIQELNHWLNFQKEIIPNSFLELLGCAIFYNRTDIIALLNIYIRENQISLEKKKILKAIYWPTTKIILLNIQNVVFLILILKNIMKKMECHNMKIYLMNFLSHKLNKNLYHI